MELYVIRDTFTTFSSIGAMKIEQTHECFTLEPAWTGDLTVKPRAIGEGRYRLIRRWSQEHKRDVPGVENVPGFSDVEIHWGNFPKDTKGCALVGESKGPHPDFIGAAQRAFETLWNKLVPVWERDEEIYVTYMNGTDDEFKGKLKAFLSQSSDGVEPETPVFYYDNGAINRARTLELARYAGLTLNPRKGGPTNGTDQGAG